jgi:hypothetical protein
VSLDPTLRGLLALGLVGSGAATLVSAAVNIYAALQLVETPDEQSLGISRGDFVWAYGIMMTVGAAMLAAGWRLRTAATKLDSPIARTRPPR